MSELHHYVPRFLLRRFGTGKKEHVQAYDKTSGTVASRPDFVATAAELLGQLPGKVIRSQ